MDFDNFIIINGVDIDSVKRAIKDWVELNIDNIKSDFEFDLYTLDEDRHLIIPKVKLHFKIFNYLVNYLKYPIDIDYKATVMGYSFNNKANLVPKKFVGCNIFIYVPENDTEYDVVFAITSNNIRYKINLDGTIKELPGSVNYPQPKLNIDKLNSPTSIPTDTRSLIKEYEKQSDLKLKKRFKIISGILLFVMILSPLLILKNSFVFAIGIFVIGFVMTFCFFLDYKMLQKNSYYCLCILYSALFSMFGLLIPKVITIENGIFIYCSVITPLSFLIMQKPIRLIFKTLMKREPVVEKIEASLGDILYSLILFFWIWAIPFMVILRYIN